MHFPFTSQSGCVKIDNEASPNETTLSIDHMHSKCKKNAFNNRNDDAQGCIRWVSISGGECALPVSAEIFVLGCACEESSAPESTASPAE